MKRVSVVRAAGLYNMVTMLKLNIKITLNSTNEWICLSLVFPFSETPVGLWFILENKNTQYNSFGEQMSVGIPKKYSFAR